MGACGARRDPGRKWAGPGGRGVGPVPGGPPRPPAAAPGAGPRYGDSPGHCERRRGKGYPGGPAGSVASGWGLFCPGAFGGAMCLGVPGVLFVWGGWSSPFPVFPCPAGSGTPKSSAVYSILQPDLGVGVLGRREPPQHPQQDPALSPPPSLHQLHILGRWKLHPSMWVGKHLVLPAPAPSSTPKFGEGMT